MPPHPVGVSKIARNETAVGRVLTMSVNIGSTSFTSSLGTLPKKQRYGWQEASRRRWKHATRTGSRQHPACFDIAPPGSSVLRQPDRYVHRDHPGLRFPFKKRRKSGMYAERDLTHGRLVATDEPT